MSAPDWNSVLDAIATMEGDPASEREALLDIFERVDEPAESDRAAFVVKHLVSVLLANAGTDAARAVDDRPLRIDSLAPLALGTSNVVAFPRNGGAQ